MERKPTRGQVEKTSEWSSATSGIAARTRLRRPRAALAAAGVLLVGGAALALALSGCGALGGIVPGLMDGGRVDTVGTVDFARPLAVPPLDEGELDASGTRVFDLTAAAATTEFEPGKQTPTWGFNGSYLGPTLVASRGETVRVDVHNELAEATTVHWHGMHLPARMDGGPHQPIAPGATWSPEWTIDQPAATLWYHPHPHGQTEAHVARGLAGMFLVRDPEEAALALPRNYGVDDIPLIVQDKRFTADGGTRVRLDPVRFGLARRLDDLAYGAGVWVSALRGRSWGALLPDIRRTR